MTLISALIQSENGEACELKGIKMKWNEMCENCLHTNWLRYNIFKGKCDPMTRISWTPFRNFSIQFFYTSQPIKAHKKLFHLTSFCNKICAVFSCTLKQITFKYIKKCTLYRMPLHMHTLIFLSLFLSLFPSFSISLFDFWTTLAIRRIFIFMSSCCTSILLSHTHFSMRTFFFSLCQAGSYRCKNW